MKRRTGNLFLAASLAFAAWAGSWAGPSAAVARADVIFFDDRAAFAAAAAELRALDFEGLPPVPVFGVLTLEGVGFSGINGVVPATAPDFGYAGPGTALVNIGVPEISSLSVSLPGGVTAVGADVLALFPDNTSPIVVTLSSGESFTLGGVGDPLPARQFVGFASDVAIASLTFRSSGGAAATASRVGLDDFAFGQARRAQAAVPEPGTLALLGTGLAALAGLSGVGAAARGRRLSTARQARQGPQRR